MLLFRRILDYPKNTLARLRDKRRATRYPVAAGFPLKVSVNLLGVDDPAKSKAAPGSGLAWAGVVADLSGTGLRLRLPPAAATARGEKTFLTLALEDFELRIPCSVAHFRTASSAASLGLALEFADDIQRKGYAQLLEAVVMGSGFAAEKAGKAKTDGTTQRYRSEGKATLTVWRDEPDAPVRGFELVMGEHTVCKRPGEPGLEVLASGHVCPAGVRKQEILLLFRIVAANLPKSLPTDVRERLQSATKPAMPPPSRR